MVGIKEGSDYMSRVSKINYYLDIAEAVSERSTCLKKHYGAIIVKNDEIISTRPQDIMELPEDCILV